MVEDGRLKASAAGIALAKHKAKLSARQLDAFEAIVDRFREAGVEVPTMDDCIKLAPGHEKDVEKRLRLAVSDGQLIHIEKQMYLHCEVEAKVKQQLSDALNEQDGMTMSAIRELLGTSRKYAVPVCEYLDRTGFTKRQGDVRVLA